MAEKVDGRSDGVNMKAIMFAGQDSLKRKKKPEFTTEEAGGVPVPIDIEIGGEKIRIQVFVTKTTLDYLKGEADRCATSVSALCALAITDWCDERQRKKQAK